MPEYLFMDKNSSLLHLEKSVSQLGKSVLVRLLVYHGRQQAPTNRFLLYKRSTLLQKHSTIIVMSAPKISVLRPHL